MASSDKRSAPGGAAGGGKAGGGKPSAGKPTGGKPAGGGNAVASKPKGGGARKPAAGGPPAGPPGGLVALVDGVALPEAESAALWHAFSEHMDQHVGDMAGFAKARGYASVKPEYRRGQAVLVVATR